MGARARPGRSAGPSHGARGPRYHLRAKGATGPGLGGDSTLQHYLSQGECETEQYTVEVN